MVELQWGGEVEAGPRIYHSVTVGMDVRERRRESMPSPVAPAAPTAVMVIVSRFAGAPTTSLSEIWPVRTDSRGPRG